jgi:hypothetical protein
VRRAGLTSGFGARGRSTHQGAARSRRRSTAGRPDGRTHPCASGAALIRPRPSAPGLAHPRRYPRLVPRAKLWIAHHTTLDVFVDLILLHSLSAFPQYVTASAQPCGPPHPHCVLLCIHRLGRMVPPRLLTRCIPALHSFATPWTEVHVGARVREALADRWCSSTRALGLIGVLLLYSTLDSFGFLGVGVTFSILDGWRSRWNGSVYGQESRVGWVAQRRES